MKIKRFEASSMSEALRQIKKEFGEEAVILSAKTIKKGQRFLGKKSSQQVVVTAAIDKKTSDFQLDMNLVHNNRNHFRKWDENSLENGSEAKGSSILKRFNPITKTGQKIIKPKMMQQVTSTQKKKLNGLFYQRFIDAGVCKKISSLWDEQMGELLDDQNAKPEEIRQALSQVIEAKGIIGTTYKGKPGKSKCVVMIGPAGVGKTSAVAKMAVKQALQHPNSIAIISLDNQRVAGSIELERFSKIMGVPFKTAFTPEELKESLSQLKTHSLVIVDTPGISSHDPIQREKLRRMLGSIDNAENLLVLNAAIQEKAMDQIIEYFRPLDIHSLLFTGLDWTVDFGAMINESERQKLPIGYLSNSPKIPDGIQVSTADYLAGMLFKVKKDDGCDDDRPIAFIKKREPNHSPYYVANRNSDIFHFHDCNAVKRINTDNMIVFKDSVEAMGQHFKPCRMCCSELIVPKPLDRLVHRCAGK